MTNADLKSNKAEAFRIRMDETPDISSLDPFSFTSGLLNFKQSLYSISAGKICSCHLLNIQMCEQGFLSLEAWKASTWGLIMILDLGSICAD